MIERIWFVALGVMIGQVPWIVSIACALFWLWRRRWQVAFLADVCRQLMVWLKEDLDTI